MSDNSSIAVPKDSAGWKVTLATAISAVGSYVLVGLDDSIDWQKVVPVVSPVIGVLLAEALVRFHTSHFATNPESENLRRRIRKRMKNIAKQLADKNIDDQTKQKLKEKYNADALALADL
ncbi:hypothetical protein [Oceanobacter sp. 4_MG-2023]|uniref:hypothetical protein n=1 Tax=Oceanobacter sp. 4_MG-2023 TaxID=3062623 RepID=UPI002734C9E0|nr:hypothetical protein [Oceanobacter sp. 4_MG-2023]MDP2548079.1 hypothetical protein [Oceanobacter sp. 4_MG-2023]